MKRIEQIALGLTSRQNLPLSFRRKIGQVLIKRDGRPFCIEIDGRPFSGALDNYIEWVVYSTRNYFEYTYLNVLRSLFHGGTVLDVGANVGNHTHAFAGFFDRVHSFEPFGKVAERLEAKAVELPNVTVHRVALGEKEDTLRFAAPDTENWGTGRIDSTGKIKVPVAKGDDYLSGRIDGAINFIKVDVEGHELPVLQGLSDTIATHRPGVMFELPKALRGEDLGQTFALFPDDYQFVAFRGQSTFPVQATHASVVAIDRNNMSNRRGKLTYLLAYGPERGFHLERGQLSKAG